MDAGVGVELAVAGRVRVASADQRVARGGVMTSAEKKREGYALAHAAEMVPPPFMGLVRGFGHPRDRWGTVCPKCWSLNAEIEKLAGWSK